MKRLLHISAVISIAMIPFLFSCGNGGNSNTKVVHEEKKIIHETEALLDFFEKSGNYINQSKIPSMISADEVFANLKSYKLIDIRKSSDYINGHIDGAVNVKLDELRNFMRNRIAASKFEKIVFICNTNHTASYAAMMFRLLGYDNVYSMKWGMSSCDKNIVDTRWSKAVSDKYANQLQTKGNRKNKKGDYPQIKTGETLAYKILENRVVELLSKKKFKITADKVFANPDKYYIINYWPLDAYVKGHIPGSIQYSPKKSLTRDSYLSTLPIDKPIVVYCYTGQHAAFVTAYLQILGYDAYVLQYSANGFMHNKLITSGIGHEFNKTKHFKAHSLVSGELPSLVNETAISEVEADEDEEDNTPTPIIKKAEEEEEGGC